MKSEEWGEVIKFANKDKLVREEIVTAALLYDDPNAVISRLGSLGMWISGVLSERRALIEYLLLELRPTSERRSCGVSVGSRSARRVFVLPDEIIGVALSKQIILEQDVGAPYARRGTVEEWRNAIAKAGWRPSHGALRHLDRVIRDVAVSGRLRVRHHSFEGRQFNRQDDTTQDGGVYVGFEADNGFVRKWRSTDNALEATLSSSNDTLLPLDEIGQVDVRTIPWPDRLHGRLQCRGKQRMRRDAAVRSSHQWRTLVLEFRREADRHPACRGPQQAGPRRSVGEGDRCSANRTKNSAFDRPDPTFEREGVRRRHEARRLDLLRDGWARILSACWSTRRSAPTTCAPWSTLLP